MSWPLVELATLAEVTAGQGAPQGLEYFSDVGLPFVRAGSLHNLLSDGRENQLEKLSPESAKQFRMRLFPKDTVIFPKSGMSAAVGNIYRLRTPCYLTSHLAAVVPNNNLNPSFLEHWLRKYRPSKLIPNESYPSIRTSEIALIKIPLPPLPEQKRIAAILDKADAIRRKREKAIELADSFLRSLFLEMFGDPDASHSRYPKLSLEECAELLPGFAFKSPEFSSDSSDTRLCRGVNVGVGEIDWADTAYWSNKSTQQFEKYLLQPEDIVIAMDRPWISSGFKIAQIKKSDLPCLVVQRVMRVRAKEPFTSSFLYHLLQLPSFTRHCKPTETTIPHISPIEIRTYKVIKPSPADIDHFSEIADSFQRSDAFKQSEILINGLFESLSNLQFNSFLAHPTQGDQ